MIRSYDKTMLVLVLAGLIFMGCSSEEYTTAKLALQQQEWEKAEEYLYKAMEVEPDNPEIPYKLAQEIHARNSEWDKMNQMLDKALAIDPNRRILDNSQTVKDAVATVRKYYWAKIHNNGLTHYNNYIRLTGDEKQTKLEEAISVFEVALSINKEASQTLSILASCYFEDNQQEKAAEYIKKSVLFDPDNFDINLTAGQILKNMDDIDGALKYYEKAVELEPSNSIAVRNLAEVYLSLDQTAKSIALFEIAIGNESDRSAKADLYFNLGLLYSQLEDFTAAEDNFFMAYDLNPDDVEALAGIAQTFENAEKWSRAEKFYRELILVEPDNPQHYHGMFRVLYKQERPEEAQRYLDKYKSFSD